ncbi:MAG: 30S ribosomal protein S7 [Patescibacteria group bacterium]|nr:30S ribosomal protein S7 [Patescibacteria group bacterium]
MPRKSIAKKRTIDKDLVYNSFLVTKLVNRVMRSGKKSIARKHVYGAFEAIREKLKIDPMIVFEKAIANIKPRVEVRSRRVGGAAYQVPILVRTSRQDSLSIRWLVTAARKRPNKEYHTFMEKLAAELIDAYQEKGGAFEKKLEVEKIAAANRAFSHLKW